MHGNLVAFHPSQIFIGSYSCYMTKMLLLCLQIKEDMELTQ
jgi:hypothetical protein